MLYLFSSMSLDFMDDSHLLFTFHHFRLMSREPEQGHDDQIIRAQVLEIPSGKVNATAEWRMHDRRQYLFARGEGSFLVRQGTDIKRLGSDLELHPYLHFPNRLQAVELSPDGNLLTVQEDLERHSADKHKRLVDEAIAGGENLPEEDVSIQMIRLEQRTVVGEAKSDHPVRLAVTTDGYVDHDQSVNNQWKIRFHPYDGKERVIKEVHSLCAPSEDFLTADTLMVRLCLGESADRYATALTLDGKELWKGRWDADFIDPNFGVSGSGRNFAISWIVATHPVDAFFSLSDGEVAGQVVQVLGASTGHLLLSLNVSPVVSAGQNFALSADGRRLAVLNKDNIEIYEVPADTEK
jgi:hypothetical protein